MNYITKPNQKTRIMNIIEEIKIMTRNNESIKIKTIAKRFGVSKNTVKRYIKLISEGKEETNVKTRETTQEKELNKHKEWLSTKMNDTYSVEGLYYFMFHEKYNTLKSIEDMPFSSVTLWRYCKENFNYSPNNHVEKSEIRYETLPGEYAQIDWKESVTLHSKNGTVFVIQIFLYKYAFSRKIRIVPVFDKKQDTLIECLIECFKKDSGIPKKILCDNMLTMIYIFEDNSKKINDRFKQFASDYGFKVIPCQAYSPQTKGKVENEAKVMNRVFTLNNEFESETELIEKILYIEDDYNSTICKGTGIKPDILFANRERQELQSLPNEKFDNKWKYGEFERKVRKDGLVTFRMNLYSVPIEYANKIVKISYDENDLKIKTPDGIIVHSLFGNDIKYAQRWHREHMLESYQKSHDNFSIPNFDLNKQVDKNLEVLGMLFDEQIKENEKEKEKEKEKGKEKEKEKK